MKPRSAPENGAFEPPSSKRIAGTEPAPMKTSSPVPMASANRRCAVECSAIPASTSFGLQRDLRADSLVPDRHRPGTIFDMIEHRSGKYDRSPQTCQGPRARDEGGLAEDLEDFPRRRPRRPEGRAATPTGVPRSVQPSRRWCERPAPRPEAAQAQRVGDDEDAGEG